jgi:hypothetical protein
MPVSTDNINNVFLGQWDEVTFFEDPLGDVLGPTPFYLGAVRDGSLEVATEVFEYFGTTYPRVVEAVFPQQVTMTFSGQIEELHRNNLRLALGQLPSTSGNYIYLGASCVQEENFGSLEVKRRKCAELGGGGYLVGFFYKTTGSGAITIGTSDEVVGVPIEFSALNDANGAYGGSPSRPLGWIYAEAPAE